MIMYEKSCYSYHTDKTPRIHIPLITNDKCFMIVDDEVIRLPANGDVYLIDTTKFHTFLNGSWETRIHIVGNVPDTNINIKERLHEARIN